MIVDTIGASIDAFDINFSGDAIFYLFWCSIRQTNCLLEHFRKVYKAHPVVLTAESIVNDPFSQCQFLNWDSNISELSKFISSDGNWKPGNAENGTSACL